MAAKKTPNPAPASARPWATSPAPEHTRVDPGSADTQYIKTLLPVDAPRPVFSSMALSHGKDASGAKCVRPGFAWNPQMDLLWALGFPEVLLIVDGFPAEPTKEAHLAYWDPDGRCADKEPWWAQCYFEQPRFVSRAGAYAALFEFEQFPNKLGTQSPAAFLKASKPVELTPAKVEKTILGAKHHEHLAYLARLLEALVGPDSVTDALCAAAESTKLTEKIRDQALETLKPILRRIPKAARADAVKRLDKIAVAKDSVFADTRFRVTRPLEYTKEKLAAKHERADWELEWVDDSEALVLSGHKRLLKEEPDIPQTRFVFTGGPPVIAAEVAHFKKFDAQDVAAAYVRDYTTLTDPLFLGPALQVSTRKEDRAKMQAWFQGHAAELRPHLEALAKGKDPKVAKLASSVLKSF